MEVSLRAARDAVGLDLVSVDHACGVAGTQSTWVKGQQPGQLPRLPGELEHDPVVDIPPGPDPRPLAVLDVRHPARRDELHDDLRARLVLRGERR
jgi:hypothetical protein